MRLPAVLPPDEVRCQRGIAGAADAACLAVIHGLHRAIILAAVVGVLEPGEDGLRVLVVLAAAKVIMEVRLRVARDVADEARPLRRRCRLPVCRSWRVPTAGTVLCHPPVTVPEQEWSSRRCRFGFVP